MAKGLTTVGVLVLLAAALHLPPPHLVLAADCPLQGELILEYMSAGGFTRTYRFVDCEGNEFYSSRYIALGDRAREWTTLQAKQALIEMGRSDLLRLFPGVRVSDQVLRQWQEEGYVPEIEMESAAQEPPPPYEHEGPTPTFVREVTNVSATGSAPDSTSQAEESGSSLLPYRDPTSAIALTEEREAEFDATEVTEPASWWRRLLQRLLDLWSAVADWARSSFGKGER